MRLGYRRVVCHDVVSLVIYYFHGREVGLPTVVFHDVVRLVHPTVMNVSMVMRSGLPTVVCHDVVRLVPSNGYIILHGREVGFIDGGLPR